MLFWGEMRSCKAKAQEWNDLEGDATSFPREKQWLSPGLFGVRNYSSFAHVFSAEIQKSEPFCSFSQYF